MKHKKRLTLDQIYDGLKSGSLKHDTHILELSDCTITMRVADLRPDLDIPAALEIFDPPGPRSEPFDPYGELSTHAVQWTEAIEQQYGGRLLWM
jgi:hypothetical protein